MLDFVKFVRVGEGSWLVSSRVNQEREGGRPLVDERGGAGRRRTVGDV